eukprot:TRINITY_DN99761_c0_g1_i1.p1 TRINITY_DN99761_c0_g1~~TRINITY_DN99761_c0_g1_i1.p1  ORF type:complete len:289 (+),score=21.82 TRINITY_DN99761_c0_g1_i1:100-867(+)
MSTPRTSVKRKQMSPDRDQRAANRAAKKRSSSGEYTPVKGFAHMVVDDSSPLPSPRRATPERTTRSRSASRLICTPIKHRPISAATIQEWQHKIAMLLCARSLPLHDQPNQILSGLFLGTYKHSRKPALLQKLGITSIINVAASSCPSTHHLYPQLQYHAISMEDTPNYPILTLHWAEANALLEKEQKQGEIVLLHCQAGVNRSATLAVAYCMVRNRWPLMQAIEHVYRQRSNILTNDFFIQQLILLAYDAGLLR